MQIGCCLLRKRRWHAAQASCVMLHGRRCDWLLYVYTLPDSYRKRGNHARPAPSPAEAPWVQDVPQLKDAQLWQTGNYQLGDIVLERSLSHPCRTRDAAVADLFLVPAWNMDIVSLDRKSAWRWCAENASSATALGGHLAALFARLEAEAAGALRRHGGADHLLLSPRALGPPEAEPDASEF